MVYGIQRTKHIRSTMFQFVSHVVTITKELIVMVNKLVQNTYNCLNSVGDSNVDSVLSHKESLRKQYGYT